MKFKLTDFDIRNICNRYVSTNESMEDIAQDYACSPTHISKQIHKAIVFRDS